MDYILFASAALPKDIFDKGTALKKNYRQIHKMDYMLFASITKVLYLFIILYSIVLYYIIIVLYIFYFNKPYPMTS